MTIYQTPPDIINPSNVFKSAWINVSKAAGAVIPACTRNG
jgi:hypothetical protein